MKASPGRLIRAHYATLVKHETGESRLLDHFVFEGVPIAAFVLLWVVVGVDVGDDVAVGLLTVSGLLSAFFFGAMLEITTRAMEWAESGPRVGRDTTRYAKFLGEIAANAGYAALVCVVTAAVFIAVSIMGATLRSVASALGLALALHLALLLLMVTRRLYTVMQERLDDAQTGHQGVTPFPGRKAS